MDRELRTFKDKIPILKELEELQIYIGKLHALFNIFWKKFIFAPTGDEEVELLMSMNIVNQQLRFLDNQSLELMKKLGE